MVKRPKIAKKPVAPSVDAENWVRERGIDPEVQAAPKPQVEMEESKGKPYPHRVSFDMATDQYKRLKRVAFEEERSLNDILREAIEEWMQLRDY